MSKSEDKVHKVHKVHIGKEVSGICKKLGLEGPFTKSLLITPTEVTAIVYLKEEDGKKYATVPDREFLPAEDDGEGFDVTSFETTIATEERTFEVRT